MIVSLNEAEVMATKAAWGAGRPWGLAQDAGRAMSTLEAMRLPGLASDFDEICVMAGGKVLETGKRETLLKSGGAYSKVLAE